MIYYYMMLTFEDIYNSYLIKVYIKELEILYIWWDFILFSCVIIDNVIRFLEASEVKHENGME